jgi:hypothetical protein
MVFRGLDRFSRAVMRGEADDVVAFLAENYQLLGLVQAVRERHRDSAALSDDISITATLVPRV